MNGDNCFMQSYKIEQFNKKYGKWLTLVLWIVICLWRIPFLNKGIDYTDTGYSLENYKNVFDGNGINGIGVFLTNLIGGLIYKLLPAYQLLAFRILHWFIGLISVYIAYCIFKRYMDKNLVLFILLGVFLTSKNGEALFNYYVTTTCLLLLSLLLLRNGLVDNKKKYIVLSGFVSAINIFFRLPNILFCFMFIGIIVYLKLKKEIGKNIVKTVFLYIGGAVLGVLCVIPIMISIMGIDKIFKSFMGFVNLALGRTADKVENILGIQEKSGHSLIAELKTIVNQGLHAFKILIVYLLPTVVLETVFYCLIKKSETNFGRNYKKIGYVFTLMFIIVSVFIYRNIISSNIMITFELFSILISVVLLFKLKRRNPEYSLIFILNIVTSCTEIIGSDLGLRRLSISNAFLILTLVLGIKYAISSVNIKEYATFKCGVYKHLLSSGMILLISGIYISAGFSTILDSYFDADYPELNHTVNNDIKSLRGMKTSEIRAKQINEYYDCMNNEKLKDSEVVVFGYFPLSFSIIDNKDYFESVQPCIDYPAVSVESLLFIIQEKQEQGIKPVIVVSYINQNFRGDDHFTSEAKMAVLNYMLDLNDYEIYHESEYFEIFIPVN